MAYRTKFGHNPKGLRYDYLVRKSSKRFGFSAEIHPMPVQRTEAHEWDLIETFKTVSNNIKMALYYPNSTGFTCGPMSCGYWDVCRAPVMAGQRPDYYDEIRCLQQEAVKNIMEGK
jgi:hypothetical protein